MLPGFLEEAILQLQGASLGFEHANDLLQLRDGGVQAQAADLWVGTGGVPGVMVGIAGVPPDAGIRTGQRQACS